MASAVTHASPPERLARVVLARGRNPTKADVWRVSRAGVDAVVKSVEKRPWHCRYLFGGLLVRREGSFLERLQSTGCVPRLLSRGPDGFSIEWVEGRLLRDCDVRGITAEQAAAVESALATIHAHGVASGDIGRSDILFTEGGRVVFLDFATAVSKGSPPVLGRLLLGLWKWRDRRRVGRRLERYRRKRELFRKQRQARLARASRAAPTAT